MFKNINTFKIFYLLTFISLLNFSQVKASDVCDYTITKNIKYGEGLIDGDSGEVKKDLYLDVYEPVNCASGNKVFTPIIQIHGGGFTEGNKSKGSESKIEFAKKGYMVFAIEYRLLSNKNKPILESVSDIKYKQLVTDFLGKDYVEEDEIKVYGAIIAMEDAIKAKNFVDMNFKNKINQKYFFWGGSAGAYTVNNMAYMSDYVFGVDNKPYGVIEISGGIPKGQYISKGDANLLIVHGTSDAIVPYTNSDELVKQANSAGIYYQRITAPGEGHGLASHDVRNWTVTETGETVFDHMIGFIDNTIKCRDMIASCSSFDIKEFKAYSSSSDSAFGDDDTKGDGNSKNNQNNILKVFYKQYGNIFIILVVIVIVVTAIRFKNKLK